MVKIINAGGERPRTIDLGGVIIETGYFRSHYEATVQRGDTLDEVARQLGTTPQELYDQNRGVLSEDPERITLQEGQVLRYRTPPSRGITMTI